MERKIDGERWMEREIDGEKKIKKKEIKRDNSPYTQHIIVKAN